MLHRLPPISRRRELARNLLFPECVVLELLRRLPAIDSRREDVVQAELAREDVHHDVHHALIRAVALGGGLALGREPVQHIWEGQHGLLLCLEMGWTYGYGGGQSGQDRGR